MTPRPQIDPPVEPWLFGSRARGDARLDSVWDLLADAAPPAVTKPMRAWEFARTADVPVMRRSDLAIWNLPNSVGYDLAREGLRLKGRVA